PAIFFRCHIYSFLMRAKVTDSAEGFRRFSSTVYLRYMGSSINLIICATNLLFCLVEQMFSDVPYRRKYTKRCMSPYWDTAFQFTHLITLPPNPTLFLAHCKAHKTTTKIQPCKELKMPTHSPAHPG
ncbi:hypothetical protein SAMN05444277_1251, partial [Parafilimonas terrae]